MSNCITLPRVVLFVKCPYCLTNIKVWRHFLIMVCKIWQRLAGLTWFEVMCLHSNHPGEIMFVWKILRFQFSKGKCHLTHTFGSWIYIYLIRKRLRTRSYLIGSRDLLRQTKTLELLTMRPMTDLHEIDTNMYHQMWSHSPMKHCVKDLLS